MTAMQEAIGKLLLRLDPIPNGRYLIGLSGGADSTALLTMLLPSVRENRIWLEAIHVNHGLRGKESDEDELFCRTICRKEGIRLYIAQADLHGKTDEASAREARFEAFRHCIGESGADALILAHNADDQAETFLMRLMRGAGADGLGCMKADETVRGIRILRPMLSIRRNEIRDALRSEGIVWREDSTNSDTAYFRNRIRSELLPVLESFSSSPVGKICNAAGLIAEDNDALRSQAEEVLKDLSDGRLMDARRLAREPYAIRSRVLRAWWAAESGERPEHALSSAQTKELDRLLLAEKGSVNLSGGLCAVRDGRFLFLQGEKTAPAEPVDFMPPETAFGSFRLTEGPSGNDPGDGRKTQEVPAGFTRGCVIRTRRPGDRIRPFGSAGSRKLQDYLTDRKIPEPFRDMIPLLCRDGEVLLVCGVGAGNIPRWDPARDNTRLTWHGEMPWMQT